MPVLEVLDPTVEFSPQARSEGVGPAPTHALKDARVGFRLDTLWRSWDWVSDEWTAQLQAAGACISTWRSKTRTGKEGEQASKELALFAAKLDFAIVGLGNCGSCTQWTINDAITVANAGVPTVAIVTAQFKDIAATFARLGSRADLRLEILPYPLDTLPEEEVRQIAKEHFAPALAALGVR
jgi:hypothetical protein